MQYSAKIIDRRGIQRLVISELIDRGTGNSMIFYQCICGFLRFMQGRPKW